MWQTTNRCAFVPQISIELKNQAPLEQAGDSNDTWTVKIKHSPKNIVLWDEKEEEENDVLGDTPHALDSRRPSNSSENEENSPVLKKVEPSLRKHKKSKKRRQLPNRGLTSTEKAITDTKGSLSELVQGSTRINIVFDNKTKINDSEEGANKTETPDDGKWKNIAAVIFDGLPIDPPQANATMAGDLHDVIDPDLGRLSEPYALPLQQSPQSEDYQEAQGPSLPQNTGSFKNNNTETQGSPKTISHDQLNQNASTDDVSGIGTSRSTYDYVIEHPTISADDVSDPDEETAEEDSKEIDFSDLEASPEMKRLAQWYPRSRPLANRNNGYKLFPGVSNILQNVSINLKANQYINQSINQ